MSSFIQNDSKPTDTMATRVAVQLSGLNLLVSGMVIGIAAASIVGVYAVSRLETTCSNRLDSGPEAYRHRPGAFALSAYFSRL